MLRPLWNGVPLARTARGFRGMKRFRAFRGAVQGQEWVYFAVPPCGRFVKVGTSTNPLSRIRESVDYLEAYRVLGIERVHVARLYQGGRELEAECLAFLAPDLVHAREWFRAGPRFRILLNRMARRFGPFDAFSVTLYDQFPPEFESEWQPRRRCHGRTIAPFTARS